MAEQQKKSNPSRDTGTPAASMQELYKKMQEGSAPTPSEGQAAPAPKYDEDRAVNTRKQLLEDYRRELEEMGKDEKKSASRPNLYEYEDLTIEAEDEPEEKGEPTVEEVTVEEPVVEEVAVEEPTVEEAAVEEPIVEEVAVEEPTVEEVAVEEPIVEEVAVEESTVEEVAVEEPTVEEVAVEEPTVEEVAVEEPVVEEVAVKEPPVEEVAVEEPVVEEVAVEEPVVEEVAVDCECTVGNVWAHEANEVFRPASPFRQPPVAESDLGDSASPSKQKDPYSVYEYDMAQEFGYVLKTREETVTQDNVMDSTGERRRTIYLKRQSTSFSGAQGHGTSSGAARKKAHKDTISRRGRLRKKLRGLFLGKKEKKRVIAEPKRISVTDDARIRENPRKAREVALRKVLLASVISVVLIFWEYLPLIPGSGYMLFGVIGNTQYPFLYIGIAAALLLMSALTMGRAFLSGLSDMVNFRCTPRSLVAFLLSLTLVNDLFSCYLLIADPRVEYGMYHFPASVFVLTYLLGSFATVRRKSDAYAVFGADRPKHMLVEDDLSEQVRNRVCGTDGSEHGRLRRFTTKDEAVGVERRLEREERYDGFPGFTRLFFVLIVFGMAAMLTSALLSAREESMLSRLSEAVRAFMWTVFLCVPLSVTEIRRLPLARISEKMRKSNVALAGDAAAAEYARVSRVAVRSELFLRKHAFCLGECKGDDPETLKYYVRSIFYALGEPFTTVLRTAKREETEGELYTDAVKLLLVSPRLVRAYVGATAVELRLGDDEKSGFLLSDPGASLKESAYRIPLGIAVEGETVGVCSLYAQNDSEYPALVRALHDHELGIGVCHYTMLPFFTEKTLRVLRFGDRRKPPVICNFSGDSETDRILSRCIRSEAADSGIAALNAPKEIWRPLVYAEKIAAYNRFAARLAWIAVLIGAVTAFLCALGIVPAWTSFLLLTLLPTLFGSAVYLFSNYFLS